MVDIPVEVQAAPVSESTRKLEQLEAFKEWLSNGGFKKHCEENYGLVYHNFIDPYIDDVLECVEMHCEDLAEQSIQDEEFIDEPDEDEGEQDGEQVEKE